MSSVYPPGRYGRRRQPGGRRRWLVGLLAVLGAAVGLAVGGQLYRQHGNPPYQPTVVGATLADGHATVRFRVNTPAGQGAVCRVRALKRGGAEIGTADVPVPPGRGVVQYTLPTTGRADAVDVPDCGPPR